MSNDRDSYMEELRQKAMQNLADALPKHPPEGERPSASNVIAFPAEAIYRKPPTLETATTMAERRALIDPLPENEHKSVEAQLADDLFAAITSRNSYSLRPTSHPMVQRPDFGEPRDLEETPGYKWGTIEAKHLFSLKRAKRQLDWLIDRIERKQARVAAKKREA